MGTRTERDLFIGQSPGGIIPVDISADTGLPHPEVLDPASVDVRIGNPEKDIPRLLELWQDPQTIEHIQGMTPDTTEEEIKALYRSSDLVLLTAESPSGLIIGTITAQKPAFGGTAAGVLRLAVDPAYRNRPDLRIGRKLVKAVNALIFRDAKDEESKGLDCSQARASVILSVDDYGLAQDLFWKEWYRRSGPELEGTTQGWSNKLNKIVKRNSQPMLLDRRSYREHHRGEHLTQFPKQRPSN